MKDVIITNDDGYQSNGVRILISAMNKMGFRVRATLPTGDSSGLGSAITVRTAISYRMVTPSRIGLNPQYFQKDVFVRAEVGTPVDCVKISIDNDFVSDHVVRPSLVLAGINNGSNIGPQINYSATVAAAREGAIHNIPSIAFSVLDYEFAARSFSKYYNRGMTSDDIAEDQYDNQVAERIQEYVIRIVEFAMEHSEELSRGIFLNVNFPADVTRIKGIKVVPSHQHMYQEYFQNTGTLYNGFSHTTCLDLSLDHFESKEDVTALLEGYVTITPIRVDGTEKDFMDTIRKSLGDK